MPTVVLNSFDFLMVLLMFTPIDIDFIPHLWDITVILRRLCDYVNTYEILEYVLLILCFKRN